MPNPIEPIKAKVTRAKQLIEDFQSALKVFHDTKPYKVGFKEDALAGKRVYYLTHVTSLPFSVPSIAADALQNLRVSLDHVAYHLEVIGNNGMEPKHRVYFPIVKSATDYPSLRKKYLKYARQQAVDAVDAAEPYSGGKGHGLWQLNMLNKTDKHKLLVAAGSFFEGVDISVDFKRMFKDSAFVKNLGTDDINKLIPPLFIRPADKLLSLKVGDELYIEPIQHEIEKDRQFLFDVSFNASGVVECESAIKTLQDMANLVENIVSSFEPLLV